MSIIGGSGVGSGLDIGSIVGALVGADRAPTDARLNRVESNTKFTLTALGNVSSAFDRLKTATEALGKPDALAARSVAVGDDKLLGASVAKGTPAGTYSVQVEQLATAHKQISPGLDAEALLGGGSFAVFVGEERVEVSIDAEDSTPAKVQAAIQAAVRGVGAQASLMHSDEGAHLVLSASQPGAAHAIRVEVGEGASPALAAALEGLETTEEARDARIVVDGRTRTVAGNRVDDLIPGVTLNLKAVGESTVTVSADAAGSRRAVQDFVTAYNAAVGAIATATRYDADTDTPAALTGDAQMRGAASQLRNAVSGVLGEAAADGLDAATLGLSINVDGTLALDTARFDAALAASPGAVEAVFAGPGGFSARLSQTLDGYVGDDGAFALRTDGLNGRLKDVDTQRRALDVRMEQAEVRYMRQFVALDSLIAQMSNTSNYLSQQLALLQS